jgi:hypothetical protein
MLEAIKLVGGIAGLLTTAFVIWDRWARGRPLAWVTAKKFGANPLEYIRIQNPGPVGVFIKSVRAYPGGLYGIAKDRSPGAMMKAQINIDVNVFLGPDDICDLPLLPLRNPSEAARDQPVRFLVFWRKTSSSYLRQVPVVIMTSTDDIQRIAAAAP